VAIDEEALYRIAGQSEAQKQVHDGRQTAVAMHNGGIATGLAGLALTGAGFILFGVAGGLQPAPGTGDSGWAAVGLSTAAVGIAAGLAGGLVWYLGDMKLNNPILSYQQAVDTANQYNRSLGH
jgi:hypothetical protein